MAIQKVCHLLLLPPSFLQLASDVDKYSRKQRERKEEKSQFMTGLSSSFHLLFAEQRYIVGMKSILKTNAMNALWSAELLLGFDGGANERTAAEQRRFTLHFGWWWWEFSTFQKQNLKKVFSIFLGRISSTQIFSACDDKEIDHRIICAKMHPDRPW